MKTIVKFPNRKLEMLRGVFHAPEESKRNGRKDIVIFPNSGLMGAEGDFRSNYRIADYLVKQGYYILRFNPSGIGLSDGFIEDGKTRDLFGAIEAGLFVDDIEDAVLFISSRDNFDSFSLVGICGGGISSLLAAAYIKKIDCVVPVGMPVVLDSDKATYNSRLSSRKAKLILSTYRNKFFSVKAWLRFCSFKSDWKTIKGAVTNYFNNDLSYVNNKDSNSLQYNMHFHSAVNILFSLKKKVLFIYGDTDTFWWEFEDLFVKKYFVCKENRPFDIALINYGNHMVSWVEMQHNTAEKISKWLNAKLDEKSNFVEQSTVE